MLKVYFKNENSGLLTVVVNEDIVYEHLSVDEALEVVKEHIDIENKKG